MATNDGRRYARNKPPGSAKKVYKYGRLVDPTVPITPEILHGKPKRGVNTRDPRYPKPSNYDDYTYPAITRPHVVKEDPKRAADWRSFILWASFGGIAAIISIVLLIVILYVLGELTGESPVLRGYFG